MSSANKQFDDDGGKIRHWLVVGRTGVFALILFGQTHRSAPTVVASPDGNIFGIFVIGSLSKDL